MRRIALPFLAGVAGLSLLLAGAIRPGSEPSTAEAAGTLPSGWPTTLQLGVSDSPGGAAAVKNVAPFGFRYQYLAGGVNTGGGWANWNSNGDFVTYYVQDSVANAITPVFTYYMIRQSSPGNGQGESDGVYNNLQNTSTMAAYWNDMKLFFQRAAGSNSVVFHVEPDLWGYVQQRASNDNGATVSAKIAGSGMTELAGLPDNMAGFAQAVVRLRNQYAPNVVLGYHMSIWGTGFDIQWSQTNNTTTDSLATRAGNFYNSLGANFELSFAEFSDRDSGFKQAIYGDGGTSWFDSDDFARHARFLKKFSDVSQERLVLWQIPMGNTKMRAMNNSWNHYQDNRVEWLLDDPTGANLQTYIDAGVVAFLFGRGADGATCACDANGDGVTNPQPINGNNLTSLNSDDDGGFFKQKAAAYYSVGAMSLNGGTAPPPPTATPPVAPPTSTPVAPTSTATLEPVLSTATPTRTPTIAPTATPTAPVVASWTTTGSTSTQSVLRGRNISLRASVRATTATTGLVDIEVYNSSGQKVYQTYWDNQSFSANVTKSFSRSWRVPSNLPRGTYTLKIGVFRTGWAGLNHWNDQAATFTVR